MQIVENCNSFDSVNIKKITTSTYYLEPKEFGELTVLKFKEDDFDLTGVTDASLLSVLVDRFEYLQSIKPNNDNEKILIKLNSILDILYTQ